MAISTVVAQDDSAISIDLELQKPDTSLFLGFLIDKESINVARTTDNEELPYNWWGFDSPTGVLTIRIPDDLFNNWQDLSVTYNPPKLEIDRVYRRREFTRVTDTTSSDTSGADVIRREIRTSDDLFGDADLNQSGSLTRGFTVGNRQDLALDSGLRLDLNGNITDDIQIQASLTDRSTPIQPDGATQNIREFDRVFIQLEAPSGRLQMGDVDITYNESRFARINRRVQGAVGNASTPYGTFGGGASVSRGRFRTQSFNGIEGVQGPYRLSGAENEEFIIVIAGSEEVYVDGVRVNRGAENEYIIDYGLGEITFTNNLVVADETRIIVEFQYITQNFTRTLFTAKGMEEGLFGGKLNIGATYIREADNKNPNTQLNLTDEDIERLRNVGDDVEDLFISGADSIGFRENPDVPLYAKIDTMLNGETFEIFKNLPGDRRSVFRVRFSNVGINEGSYRRVGEDVNGIVYEWVGNGAGRYEPIIRLRAPVSHQMLSLDGEFEINQHLSIDAEWAISEFDRNRFSDIGNSDNTDMALNGRLDLSPKKTGIGSVEAGFEQTYIGEKFEFFDRPREIEFDRRWNLTRSPDAAEKEIRTTGHIRLSGESGSSIRLDGGRLSRNRFNGYRGEINVGLNERIVPLIDTRASYVQSRDGRLFQEGYWWKNLGTASKLISKGQVEVRPLMRWETEKRVQRTFADSLLPQSIAFYDFNPALLVSIGEFSIEAGLGYRENKRPFENQLKHESISRSQRFSLSYRPSTAFSTSNRLQFREKETNALFLESAVSPRSKGVLMSSVTSFDLLDGDLNGELFYQTNTERRALLQETYIEVGPELGQYIWVDLNGDNVEQIDEFFPEVTPNEGIYIRQFVPSDNLEPVIDVTFRIRNEIGIGKLFERTGAATVGALEHLSWSSLFEIQETSRENDLSKVYLLNPSVLRNSETSINGRRIIRQRLSWRTDNRNTELALAFNDNRSLIQRSAGVQTGSDQVISLDVEQQLSRPLRLLTTVQRSDLTNDNSRFASRTYSINGIDLRPGISYFVNRSAQLELRAGYSFKESKSPAGSATARTYSVENRAQLFLFERIQNRLRLQFRHTDVEGSVAGQAEYELTEGIGRGANVVWSLNSDYRASSLLRISLQYNGRTTGRSEIIQTLRFVVSAVF